MALPQLMVNILARDRKQAPFQQVCPKFRIFESWKIADEKPVAVVDGPLSYDGLTAWLATNPPLYGGHHSTTGLKLLIIEISPHPKGTTEKSKALLQVQGQTVLQKTLEAFGLPTAIQHCYDFGGANTYVQFPVHLRVEGNKSFYCRFPALIGLAWTKEPGSDITKGVVVMWVDEHTEIMESFLTQLRERQADVQLPLVLPFICSLVYFEYRLGIMRRRAQAIQDVEVATGYNTFDNKSKSPPNPLKVDHLGLSTRMTGTKAELVVARHRLCEFSAILKSLEAEFEFLMKPSINTDGRSLRVLIEMQTCLRGVDQLCTSLINQTECHIELANIQIDAIFNSKAQLDQHISIGISESMKTLALITLIFLPGTFVASIFAMPLLKWDAHDGENVVRSRFWIYCALAGPVTFFFAVLWIWPKGQTKPQGERTAGADKAYHSGNPSSREMV